MLELVHVKWALLVVFVMIIPLSALSYHISRSLQRKSEIERYINILNIRDRDLFEQHNQGISFLVSVTFITIVITCFWVLLLFGNEQMFADSYSYLFANLRMMEAGADVDGCFKQYQSEVLLTFNMAFLGAYIWGIQNIVRRYSMNDLIPVAYYSLGVRIIFACLLVVGIYHLVEATPAILASFIDATPDSNAGSDSGHMLLPIFAFLVGMFPQRGLNWLTTRFSIFSDKGDPSVTPLPLEMIEGITTYDKIRLQELGIETCYDLATADYIPLIFKTPYSPRLLINWVLQAKLCVYFGSQVKELRDHGIHTAWQFLDYDKEHVQQLVLSTSLTEDTLTMVKANIENDAEIRRLVEAQLELSRYWDRGQEDSAAAS